MYGFLKCPSGSHFSFESQVDDSSPLEFLPAAAQVFGEQFLTNPQQRLIC